jgi:SP family sugar:H+ symporter-like MFS transporter
LCADARFFSSPGILIQGWQQLTGINFIFYYGTTFFERSGISNPFIITIIVRAFLPCPTFFSRPARR